MKFFGSKQFNFSIICVSNFKKKIKNFHFFKIKIKPTQVNSVIMNDCFLGKKTDFFFLNGKGNSLF